ncbi:MAG: serine/threonine-protein kinase [Candidatus Sulfotelmatobacter sp.]
MSDAFPNPELPNSEGNSDPEATLDSAVAPAGFGAAEFGSIGPYRLIRRLGEGGMGQVWLAEQSAPVKREVALKIIRAGQYDHSALARFDMERQALAIMDHPAIAKVFDAGSTSEGQPYFVMEYVPGLPITQYCDRKRLTARERLELFIKVCEGVQHAHQKAIIHRDLKPSNILVVEVDGQAMPRIIDFGIAKAIAQRTEDETLMTRVGGMVGTPGYMSPEQADPSVQDIDTRTDVYSLGVVLYVLLTGFLPFDAKQWQTRPFHEVLRQLHEEDPPSPSTRIIGEPTATAVAESRKSDPRQLASLLRGDLDWITLKALEKDRARRYGTPSELAADIHHYLRNEPVTAHKASVAYRAQKYVQRHKFGVAGATALALLLIAFAIMQAIQLRRITRERDRADRVTEFMTGMFKVADPSEARGNTVTAREILDKSSKDIDQSLSNDPELQAKMMYTMADTYTGLGLTSRAKSLLEGAVEIQRRALGPENPETLRSLSFLASLLEVEGLYAEAEKMARETLEVQRRVLGPEHPDTLHSMRHLADALRYEGHYVEAEKLLRETIDVQRRVLGPENIGTLNSMTSLATTLIFENRYADAEKEYRATLDIQRRVLGAEHPDTLYSMNALASDLVNEGRFAEADELERKALDIKRRILGPEHPQTVYAMESLSATLLEEERYEEAEKLLRETLEIESRFPIDAGSAVNDLGNEATALSHLGRFAEAEKLFRDAILKAEGSKQPGILGDAWYNFAGGAAVAGRRDEALQYLGRAVDQGYESFQWMEVDNDIKSLRGDSRFEALVAKARDRAAAHEKAK